MELQECREQRTQVLWNTFFRSFSRKFIHVYEDISLNEVHKPIGKPLLREQTRLKDHAHFSFLFKEVQYLYVHKMMRNDTFEDPTSS